MVGNLVSRYRGVEDLHVGGLAYANPCKLVDGVNARQRCFQFLLIILSPGLSDAIVPAPGTAAPKEPARITVIGSPLRQTSVNVVHTAVTRFRDRASIMFAGTQSLITSMAMGGYLTARDMDTFFDLGWSIGNVMTETELDAPVKIDVVTESGQSFNWLNYFASSMAILFLLLSAAAGGRTFLDERKEGTFSRLMVTPTPPWQLVAGKISGIALNGMIQVFALWGATSLFGAYWGPALPVLSLIHI